ncbi:hypothetical protein DV515_00018094 [Chloebia gouldiae]|uniref:Uncharacterized protein n=1 Tax=Chloebia gouldiae TaxID=44316 RepID=A0A3L8Q8K1_CHLGU|nr:hypothetical protein DV515_00018093 [Chloebia gouldiae]RLV63616.1 hypothetical protein DV515_00018094 [Chloebia gouldiae]
MEVSKGTHGRAQGHRGQLHPRVPAGAAWLPETPIVSGCPPGAASPSPRTFRAAGHSDEDGDLAHGRGVPGVGGTPQGLEMGAPRTAEGLRSREDPRDKYETPGTGERPQGWDKDHKGGRGTPGKEKDAGGGPQ